MVRMVVNQSMCQLYECIFDSFSKVTISSVFLSEVKVLDPSKAGVRMLVVTDRFALAVVCELVCSLYEAVQRMAS